jgi:hypothetical protein
MDSLVEEAGKIILGYGMPGVIIIGLLYDRWRILSDLKAFTEARILEGKETSKALSENTVALTAVAASQAAAAEASRDLANAIEAMDKTLDRLDRARAGA